jgi:hypothetical protein
MTCPRCGATHQYVTDQGDIMPVPLGLSLLCACGGPVVPVPAPASATVPTVPTSAARRPVVRLVGQDGNAFNILARCRRAAKRAGWTQERIDAVMQEMRAGGYDHLLMTAMTHFEVK